MSTIDFMQIREELTNVLRNGNILSLTVRNAQTQTDSYTATAGQTQFTLTKTVARNIRSVTVASVAKYIHTDWTIEWVTGVLTLGTGATVGDAVSIQYDYSSAGAEKVYPDMPRSDLTLTSYPRVGIQLVSMTTEPLGLGGTTHISDILLDIIVWVPTNRDSSVGGGIGGTEDLSDIMTLIRSTIRSNAKSFQNFKYITPMGLNPIISGTNNKIIQQSATFQIKFKTE